MSLVRPPALLFRCVCLVLLSTAAHAAWREQDEHIKSRGDVTVHALIACVAAPTGVAGKDSPRDPPAEKEKPAASACADKPADIAIFFPGAEGKVRPARAGISEHATGANARPSTMGLLAEKLGMAVAMGLPSDQPSGVSIAWRLKPEHVGDAGAIVDALAARYPQARLTLIGMSAGSISVTAVADAIARRGAPKLRGMVVLSGIASALGGDRMKAVDAAGIPVLLVHHRRDSCTPYREIAGLSKRYDVITIDDVRQPPVEVGTRDCLPGSAHVFGNRETFVYEAVAEWIRTGKVKRDE